MVVPHSQKGTFNFQTNIFSIVFTLFLLVSLISSFLYFSIAASSQAKKLKVLKEETLKTQANLDSLKNETNNLMKNAKDFQSTLSTTLTSLGLKSVMRLDKEEEKTGDLMHIFDFHEGDRAYIKEAGELRLFSDYLHK